MTNNMILHDIAEEVSAHLQTFKYETNDHFTRNKIVITIDHILAPMKAAREINSYFVHYDKDEITVKVRPTQTVEVVILKVALS